ncbi:MAG: hypothetical protein HY518_00265 [Candidatus Aenigmarchaeota archaeon]|nr:hypothetical protein [Candidatus Aenigmarchaeota archaeon]
MNGGGFEFIKEGVKYSLEDSRARKGSLLEFRSEAGLYLLAEPIVAGIKNYDWGARRRQFYGWLASVAMDKLLGKSGIHISGGEH